MDIDNLNLLMQYVSSLEDASHRLDKAYYSKNLEEVEKIKKFILEIKSKIDDIL